MMFWPKFPVVWLLSKDPLEEPCKGGKLFWNKTEPFPVGRTDAAANEPFVVLCEPRDNVLNNCG